MAATLDDIKKELIANRKVTDDILKTNTALVSEMTEYFKDLKEAARQNLLNQKENKREAKATTPGAFGKAFAAQQPKGKGLFGIPGLGVLQTLLGSLAAVSLALAGLRGWEKAALKNIGSITKSIGMLFPKSVGNSIQNSFLKLRKALLTSVGLDATLKKFGDPKSGLKTSVGAQIFSRFEKFRGRLLNSIGLGVDGKPIVVRGEQGLRVPVLSRITGALNRVFEPIIRVSDGIFDYFKSSRGVVGFLRGLGFVGGAAATLAGGTVGRVARIASPIATVMGKILLPLGILMSAKKAIDEFFASPEGTPLSEKLEKAAFAFLGDFIGAPLNLLKGGVSYLFKAAFGIETDKDGNVLPGQGVGGKIAEVIDKFDFVALIKNIPDFVRTVINEILGFLKDPIGVGKNVLGDIIGGLKDLFKNAMRAILYSIDIPGAKKIADSYFMTDEQRLAEINKQQKQLQSSLSNLSTDESVAATLAEKFNISIEEAKQKLGQAPGGDTFKDLNSKDVIAQQNLIFEQLQKLSEERTELMQQILIGQKPASVVNAPTNNINNVSQGINYPFPTAITNGLVFR